MRLENEAILAAESAGVGVSSLERVVCPACGEAGGAALVRVPDHEYALDYVASYAHCGQCRTAFQCPMPRGDELAAFYPAAYHAQGRRGFLAKVRNQMRLKRLVPLLDGDGALLDYGCGDGSFLVHAAEALPGRRFYGFEIDAEPSRASLVDGRVTLIRGSHADLMKELPACRVITMNHVIEHLPNPLETLSELRERLVPGGSLEGQTPAAGSLEHKLFGSRWSGYHAPRHTVVFSRSGLAAVLERARLADVSVRAAFNPAGIAVSLATLGQKKTSAGAVRRGGPGWLFWLGLATWLAPLDLLSGAPGIVDFRARRAA